MSPKSIQNKTQNQLHLCLLSAGIRYVLLHPAGEISLLPTERSRDAKSTETGLIVLLQFYLEVRRKQK